MKEQTTNTRHYAVLNANAIYGIGHLKSEARADYSRWVDDADTDNLDRIRTTVDDEVGLYRITERLYRHVQEYGGADHDVRYHRTEDGVIDLVTEAE